MDNDFPAAHSMDTLWFAVDAAGHVAIFDSGEEGHVPQSVRDAAEMIEELWIRSYPQEEAWSWERDELVAKLGVFYFDYAGDYGDSPIPPYNLTAAPEMPLHVDQLPPNLRKQISQFVVADTDFASCKWVQPLEQEPCFRWSDEVVAYLCSDGKTVRPIPGMEDQFAEYCKQLRAINSKEASKFIFEDPNEKAEAPHRREKNSE